MQILKCRTRIFEHSSQTVKCYVLNLKLYWFIMQIISVTFIYCIFSLLEFYLGVIVRHLDPVRIKDFAEVNMIFTSVWHASHNKTKGLQGHFIKSYSDSTHNFSGPFTKRTILGPYSLSTVLPSNAVKPRSRWRLDVLMIVSLCNLTGISAALLPMGLWNFRVIKNEVEILRNSPNRSPH